MENNTTFNDRLACLFVTFDFTIIIGTLILVVINTTNNNLNNLGILALSFRLGSFSSTLASTLFSCVCLSSFVRCNTRSLVHFVHNLFHD
ncbi:MAG: hypothetical protein KNU04_gp81 [crAssphage sp. isolate ctbg_1]|uniref:Uncharacterized protein n=1 Tax=crAssphage sp. isolate ctbg_1 TaxID=2989854 RepID=A0A345MT08_9CAUD|nr:MAG: hypothetical protein KNU04_gp81 [crAssphage sp. isolate ctbg_1]AXH74508.1 MAG: hypothetical protein [crAssphage sp. isolate ctbg_1]